MKAKKIGVTILKGIKTYLKWSVKFGVKCAKWILLLPLTFFRNRN